jgi:peptide deformylase
MNDKLLSQIEQFAWSVRELPICYFGNPVLRTQCTEVATSEFGSAEIQRIEQLLIDTLQKYRQHSGIGRGLAANQVGESKRMIAVWRIDHMEVLHNPRLISSEGHGRYPESCLSSGALLIGDVVRPWVGTFIYQDSTGKSHQLKADEKETRILLHEIDHLDGVVCNDKYEPKTERFVTGGADEVSGYQVTRIT